MAVVVICRSCAVRLTLTDDSAGTTFACPKCRNAISAPALPVPPSSPPPAPTSNPQARAEQPPSEPTGTPASGSTLRFKCPACHKVYKIGRADAGKEMLCKGCGAILVIPNAPTAKPLHGIPLPATGDVEPEEDLSEASGTANESALSPPNRPTPPPLPPPLPAAPPAVYDWPAQHDEDDEEEEEPSYRYRRRRRARRSGIVTAVAVVFLIQGVLNLACAFLILVGGAFLARAFQQEAVIGALAGILAVIVVLLGTPDLIAAYGISNRRSWGYVLGLVLGGLHCLYALASILWGDACSLVLNGAIGIFVLVVLCNPRYSDEFS